MTDASDDTESKKDRDQQGERERGRAGHIMPADERGCHFVFAVMPLTVVSVQHVQFLTDVLFTFKAYSLSWPLNPSNGAKMFPDTEII